MAAPECEREVRKRRERRDSGNTHERKERRPQSEERLPSALTTPPLQDLNRLESERRAERLSRARRPQHGGKRRRQPPRLFKAQDQEKTKENECLLKDDEEQPVTPTICNTAQQHFYEQLSHPESIEFPVLHRQLDFEEPARSIAVKHARPEDQAEDRHPVRDNINVINPNRRLEKINKKMAILKKSIQTYESEYELTTGMKITPAERITDVQLTKMHENLQRLQTEKRCIKSDPAEYALKVLAAKQQKERDEKLDLALNSDKSMSEVVLDIELWLTGCREAEGRTSAESSWSCSQLASEKMCVQRALLKLEASRGRPPAHSIERGAARHLYERYRTVKRALLAAKADTMTGTNVELATIHEHETMLFNSSVDSSSDSQDKHSERDNEQDDQEQEEPTTPTTPQARADEASTTSSNKSGTNSEEAPIEGLHCMTLDELSKALKEAKINKMVLRRSLKEYEQILEVPNSRKSRDEKKIADEISRYKALRAKIKLLNALINKMKGVK